MVTTPEPTPEPQRPDDVFVDFANTLQWDRGIESDEIADPDALLGWLRRRGLISERGRAAESARLRREPGEGERRLERYRHLRGLLHAIAGRTSDGQRPTVAQLRELNHILRHGLHYHQLRLDRERASYILAQIGDRLDQARATIASGVAQFLAEESPERLRTCANEECRFVFVDRSPTGRRRWCDMRTCGNQAKVARHRAKVREGDGPA